MLDAIAAWPTIDEAAAQLQTSARTIQRHNQRGALELRKRPRPGRKPENVCNPADLDKLKATPYVLKPEGQHPAATGIATRVTRAESSQLSESLLERLVGALEQSATPAIAALAVAPDRKLWLTLDEAAAYSGFSRRILLNAIHEEKLRAMKDGPRGAWIVPRAALEAFAQ